MFKKIVWLGFSTKGKNAKDAEKYIKSLVDGWATEFFTGYNPGYWSNKFGFEVTCSYYTDIAIYTKNQNNLWVTAIKKERNKTVVTFKILEEGETAPVDSTSIPYHWVFDVKFDFTRKAF